MLMIQMKNLAFPQRIQQNSTTNVGQSAYKVHVSKEKIIKCNHACFDSSTNISPISFYELELITVQCTLLQ